MNSEYYCKHILCMLNDEELYVPISANTDNTTRKLINELVTQYEECLCKEEVNYLTKCSHNTSFFYGLPKIHKSTIVSKAIKEQNCEYIEIENPSDLKFKPIVGGPNSATQRSSDFLDSILKPVGIIESAPTITLLN